MMRIVFCVIGVIVVALPILRASKGFAAWTNIWLARGTSVVLILGGILLIVAGVKKYRGEWPTVFGFSFTLFAIAGFSSAIDDSMPKSYEDAALRFGLVVFCLVAGVLLLFSGHKLHKYSSQSELIPEIQNNNVCMKSRKSILTTIVSVLLLLVAGWGFVSSDIPWLGSPYWKHRVLAVGKLTDQTLLATITVEDKHYRVRSAAAWKHGNWPIRKSWLRLLLRINTVGSAELQCIN